MIRVNIAEAKATFSRLIRAAQSGESVIICDRNVPIVELRPVPQPQRRKRVLGPARPGFEVPDSFFEPLPRDLLLLFEGEDP